jgi:hypothetical protein
MKELFILQITIFVSVLLSVYNTEFYVEYYLLSFIISSVFHITLLCSVLPFVLHMRVSHYAFCICLAKKWPQMQGPANLLNKPFLLNGKKIENT